MAYPPQASTSAVTAAGLVRLTELAARYLYLKANYQPVDEVVGKGIDLRQKIEGLAVSATVAQQGIFLRYLGETYDLPDGIYTDPVEHAKLPPVPANGAQVRPIVLRIQDGKVLRIQGNKLLGIGYRLMPNAGPPVFNTTLTNTVRTVGAVTFTGLAGDTFEFNMPMSASTGGPQQMFLFVNGIQEARVDFPSDAVGQYFRFNFSGVAYLGTFQIVPLTFRVDLVPE